MNMNGETITVMDKTVCTEFEYDPQYLLWLTYKSESGHFYYVVSDKMRTEYYLFKDKRKLAKKSDNPLDLYKYIK